MLHRRPALAEPVAGGGAAANAEAVDSVTYARVQRIREQLGLGNEQLAAVGCNEIAAKTLLKRLVDYCTANRVVLEAVELAEAQANRELADAMRQLNVGPRNASTKQVASRLGALKSQMSAARATKQAAYQQAAESLVSQLSSLQQSRVSALRDKATLPGEFKFVSDLSAVETAEIRQVAARSGVGSKQWKIMRDRMMVGARATQVNETIQAINQNVSGVCAAEAAVLPLPANMKRQTR